MKETKHCSPSMANFFDIGARSVTNPRTESSTKSAVGKWLTFSVSVALTVISFSLPPNASAASTADCTAIIAYTNSALGGDQEALHRLRQLADQGDAFAQAMMANVLYATSTKYYLLLSTSGNAMKYARQSAHEGNGLGMSTYGAFTEFVGERDHKINLVNEGRRLVKESFPLLQKGSSGSCPAPYLLALSEMYGTGGVLTQNYSRAVSVAHESAALDYLPADAYLGQLYGYKNNPHFDQTKAVIWARRAAMRGYLSSITQLGEFYEVGTGVNKDPAKALALYKEAADRGYPIAEYKVGLAYLRRLVALPADKQKQSRYLKQARSMLATAVTSGYAPAMPALMYSMGGAQTNCSSPNESATNKKLAEFLAEFERENNLPPLRKANCKDQKP